MVKAPTAVEERPDWHKPSSCPPGMPLLLARRVAMRRRQLLLHSYLIVHHQRRYIQQSTFRQWVEELSDLQAAWGSQGFNFYDKQFEDFSTWKIFDLSKYVETNEDIKRSAYNTMANMKEVTEKEPSPL